MAQGFTNPKGSYLPTGVSAASYGSSSAVGTFTVDAFGRLTAAASVSISFNAISPITTTGDLIYSSSGTTNSRLAIGSGGNVLTVVSGLPSWQPASAGTPSVTKVLVRLVSVVNVSVSSAPGAIESTGVVSGDRVLLTAQTTGAENGIWVWNGTGSAMTRPTDFSSGSTTQCFYGVQVYAYDGLLYKGTSWFCSTSGTITIDTTSTVFTAMNTDLYKNLYGILQVTTGGTGLASLTTGDTLYASATSTFSKLTGNTTAIKTFMSMTSSIPSWDSVIAVAPAAKSSGVQTCLSVTGAVDTGRTASTEVNDILFNCARTVTWNTGALTTQRAVYIQAPTYAFTGGSTINEAATLAISGAPGAGANATLTNSYAFWVQGGITKFADATVAGSAGTGAVVVAGSVGVGNRCWVGSNIITDAALHQNVATISSTGSITASQGLILVNATSGNITLTLPAAVTFSTHSQNLTIQRVDASANTVTVQRAGSDTVNGGTAGILIPSTIGFTVHLRSDASTAWYMSAVLEQVSGGGTGQSTLGANAVLTGNGTSAIGSNTNFTWNGTTVALTGAFSQTGNLTVSATSTTGGSGISSTTAVTGTVASISAGVNSALNITGTASCAFGSGTTSSVYAQFWKSGTGHIASLAGVTVSMTISNTGTIDEVAGVYINQYQISGGPTVTKAYGLTIGNVAISGATNYAIKTLIGSVQFGDALTVVPAANYNGGGLVALTVTGAGHSALAASTENIDINVDLNRTVQWATGAITTQRAFVVKAPTYGFVGASTITTAATFAVTGAPGFGANATITNNYALWVQNGKSQFDGILSAGVTSLFAGTATFKDPASIVVTQSAGATSSNPTALLITGAAHLAMGLSTETPDVNFNLARTVQWGNATPTTQRAFLVQAPTYSCDTVGQTITTAATFAITGAPAAGTNVTLTKSYTLWVQAGLSVFDDLVQFKSYAVASLPAGAAGRVTFASNGRKNGEGAGLGTGVLVFHDGTAWRACDTGATVAA